MVKIDPSHNKFGYMENGSNMSVEYDSKYTIPVIYNSENILRTAVG
jgi:hypothetical protein